MPYRLRGRCRVVLVIFLVICLRPSLVLSLQCTRSNGSSIIDHNKWLSPGAYTGVAVDCRSRGLTRVPNNVTKEVTQLDLSRNKIPAIGANDFVNMTDLRILVLSDSRIQTLANNCFQNLTRLEQLDLNENNFASLPAGVFAGLHSLRVLTMTGRHATSYLTQFVSHTPELRVLSLSAVGDATIPAEYARLPRLEVLDFYRETVRLEQITAAMFDNIRDSNITTLSFRCTPSLKSIETAAFSNLPNLHSLVLTCSRSLSYTATMASLAATTNTSVDTVVLDGTKGEIAIFREADFCFPFWRRLKRLSTKCVRLASFDFNYAGCLTNLREVSLDHNTPSSSKPIYPNISAIAPKLSTLSVSHVGWCADEFNDAFCYERYYLLDVDDYFPERPPVLPKSTSLITNDTAPCTEKPLGIGNMPFPTSLEFLHMVKFGSPSPRRLRTTACLSQLRVRYLNISMNTFTKDLCSRCRLYGVSLLEIADASHGALELITPEFMQHFTNLRFLNFSHNSLGVTGSDLTDTFSHLRLLEDINLSHNRLSHITPRAFEHCTCLKRLNLADNELIQINIYMDNMEALEYIDLSGNRLVTLSDAFMTTLDQHVHVLTVDIRREMFVCNCESVTFLRWSRVTHVRLTEKDKLTCSYGDRDNVWVTEIDVDQLEAGCQVSLLPVVVPIIAVVIFITVATFLVRYHRWYIKYHLVLCWLRDVTSSTNKQYDAMVAYFLHASNSRDQEGGVARISRWVCTRLLPRAEDEWGLRLYVGDRDDLGGASKMHNFVRGFQSSDKVVVCLTREFIEDSDCMNYLATALDSSKPLSKYIFVLFDDIQPTSVPRRLRQLLLPNAPSIALTWGDITVEDEHEHSTFWRRMRDALTRDPDQERCRRQFDVIPLLVFRQEQTEDFDRQ
ncbi:hypothetical protein NP493_14g06035 [Ridgeia piscesae]|uniref:TIR domain-containing protein n=1 Tax=Ridgeia piscesae TaxID=27915 RepID=A0AAD9UKS4_RIDPI|nr:hypothetical protein NP493_14g06035 [Ridgeia piscesae]